MTISASAFTFVSELVKRQAAIVIGPGKEYLVESRLLPLARDAGLDDVGALIARLQGSQDDGLASADRRSDDNQRDKSFFRDRDPFNALSQAIVPELCKLRRTSHRLTVWSAACSTGQEPYSIAMTLLDHPLITSDWQIDVLASDINGDVLERARRARYSQLEVNRGLPASLLVRHFERAETDWRVVPAVRKLVRFSRLNLAEPFERPSDGRRVPAQRPDLLRSGHQGRGPAPDQRRSCGPTASSSSAAPRRPLASTTASSASRLARPSRTARRAPDHSISRVALPLPSRASACQGRPRSASGLVLPRGLGVGAAGAVPPPPQPANRSISWPTRPMKMRGRARRMPQQQPPEIDRLEAEQDEDRSTSVRIDRFERWKVHARCWPW